jgi:hypothetical protein
MNVTDGSAGVPGVRLAQFVNSFPNGVLGSVCDASYAPVMQAIATKVGALPRLPCLTGNIQLNGAGVPDCSVTAYFTDPAGRVERTVYQNCAANGNTPPCWSLATGDATCTGQLFKVTEPTNAQSLNVSVSCSLCAPGVSAPGC